MPRRKAKCCVAVSEYPSRCICIQNDPSEGPKIMYKIGRRGIPKSSSGIMSSLSSGRAHAHPFVFRQTSSPLPFSRH